MHAAEDDRAARARRAPAEAASHEGRPTPHPIARLQGKMGNGLTSAMVARLAVQREGPEDDELQTKRDPHALARQEAEEEEELQTKREGTAVGLDGGAVSSPVAGAIEARRGTGSALDDTTRSRMEGAYGASFEGVRVHQDSESDALAANVSARAFTTGSDIFLRANESQGDTSLMAHELAHVVQQSAGGGGGDTMTVGRADDPLEREADDAAATVMAAGPRPAEEETGAR